MGSINTSIGPGRPLEIARIYTPLGIRFWDLTLNLPVTDGLVVQLRQANSGLAPLTARRNGSGVYMFFGLPGLHAVEYPGGEGFGPSRSFTYIVTVTDLLNRFLPAVLTYTLDETGAVLVNGFPDPTRGARLAFLFSAPGRPAPPGVASVTATLADRDVILNGAPQPAAWAVLRIQVTGQPEVWTGIADYRGSVKVLFPFPLVDKLKVGSPPGAGSGSLADVSWELAIHARYTPAAQRFPLAGTPGVEFPWAITPSLKTILEDQTPAAIWSNVTTPVTQLTATLPLGQDVVLRSSAGSPPSLSVLMISQGTSPP